MIKGTIMPSHLPLDSLKTMRKLLSIFVGSCCSCLGVDIFNEYLRGKQFILFADPKPLEKLGHLHTKMLSRLQATLLEHDFIIQLKKGRTMPADYL